MAAPYQWQQDQWRQLADLQDSGRLPHGLMFSGPAEIGKRDFALRFARLLLCRGAKESDPCGQCKACLLFQAATHPDFLLVEAEEKGKAIRVDQIRRLGEFAGKTASMGEYRVIVVCPAEDMNLNAANAFLKTLEEPGEGVILLLVVHQPGALLPTIRSRCRILSFPLPDKQQVAGWLMENAGDGADVEHVMSLSGGRPLRARRLLETELREQLEVFQQTLEGMEQRRIAPLDAARVLQGLPKSDALEWFQYQVYDRIRADATGGGVQERTLFRFLDRLNATRQRLLGSANPNPQLAWEEILMDWKSVLDLSS